LDWVVGKPIHQLAPIRNAKTVDGFIVHVRASRLTQPADAQDPRVSECWGFSSVTESVKGRA
jgi:hypothetical protein